MTAQQRLPLQRAPARTLWLPAAVAAVLVVLTLLVWRLVAGLEQERVRLVIDKTAVAAASNFGARLRSQSKALERQAERLDRGQSEDDQTFEFAQYKRDMPALLGAQRRVEGRIVQQSVRAPLQPDTLFQSKPSPGPPFEAAPGYRGNLSAPFALPDGRITYLLTFEHEAADGTATEYVAALDAAVWIGEALGELPNHAVDVNDGTHDVFDHLPSQAPDPDWTRSSTVQEFGHTWTILLTPTDAAVADLRSPLQWSVLTGGLLLALTLALALRSQLIGRERALERREAHAAAERESERSRMAEAARDAAQRDLGSILESITDVFVIVDRAWNYVYVNDALSQRLGRPRADLIGRNLWQMRPEFTASPEAELVRRAMRDRVPLAFEYRSPQGSAYQARVYPHNDGLALYFHDVTEQDRVAARLRKHEELLSQAQSIAHIGSFVAIDGQPELWSPELFRIVGIDPGETPSRFSDFLPAPDRERLRDAALQLPTHSGEAELKARVLAAGELKPVRVRLRLERDPSSPQAHLVGTVQDISQQERVETALSAALSHSRQQSAKFRALNRAMLLISAKLGHSDLHQVLVEELREAVDAQIATLHLTTEAAPLVSASANHAAGEALQQSVAALASFATAQRPEKILRLSRAEAPRHRLAQSTGAAPQGLLSIALYDRRGKLLGFLQAADRYDGDFDADDEAIALQFAQIASIAIGWSRLIDDLRSAEASLSKQLIEARRNRSLLAEAEQVARLGSWETADGGQNPLLRLSEQAAHLLGVGAAQVPFDALLERVDAEDQALVRARFEAVFAGRESEVECEFRLAASARWLHLTARFAREDDDSVRCIGTLQDVSEARIAAAQDRQSAYTFAGIAAGAPLADSLGDVVKLYENSYPDGLCSILLADADMHLHTAAAPRLPQAYSQAIEGVAAGPRVGSCGTAAWRRERVIVRDTLSDPLWADYADLAREHGLRACWSTPILDRSGSVLGTFAVYYREVRDPTAAELDCVDRAAAAAAVAIAADRARERIAISQQRFRSLFTFVPEAVFALDMQGVVTECNVAAETVSGYTRAELIGRPLDMTVAPEDRARFAEHLALASAGTLTQIELTRQRRDGTRYITLATKTPILVDGALDGVFSIVRDVTEERASRRALEDALRSVEAHNRELEEFAFVASHDLQEPLRKVRAFGDRLRLHLGEAADADTRDFIERMRQAAERMQRLIGDLLSYSRVAKRELTRAPVDLGDVARGVLADLETRIAETHARIDVGPLPTLRAEETQMRQMLQNLIGNALKFRSPERTPHIVIRAETFRAASEHDRRTWIRLSVTDNGIGFDDRHAERIFTAFQRLHGMGEYEGSGIGLAIVRRIAERHGGRVSASGKPDGGAAFTVEIPQSDVETEPRKPTLRSIEGGRA